jgi:hypothetical protein
MRKTAEPMHRQSHFDMAESRCRDGAGLFGDPKVRIIRLNRCLKK